MSEVEESFGELIRRVRAGDAAAAAELLHRYEPEIRLKVRTWLRLRNPMLRRTFDSMDICQSVMANFFLRAAAGQFDLDEPEQLLRLLVVMARNKLSENVKRQQSQRRDIRRNRSIAEDGSDVARDETPSQVVSGAELLREFQSRLSDEERKTADLRASGVDWASIAAQTGGTAEGRRKQWARAVDRVARELGLVEDAAAL